jgi:hypothetical protein
MENTQEIKRLIRDSECGRQTGLSRTQRWRQGGSRPASSCLSGPSVGLRAKSRSGFQRASPVARNAAPWPHDARSLEMSLPVWDNTSA